MVRLESRRIHGNGIPEVDISSAWDLFEGDVEDGCVRDIDRCTDQFADDFGYCDDHFDAGSGEHAGCTALADARYEGCLEDGVPQALR